jgi:hypothetical protein
MANMESMSDVRRVQPDARRGQPQGAAEHRVDVKLTRAVVLVTVVLVLELPGPARAADTVAATTALPCAQVIDTGGPPYRGWTKVFDKVWLPRHTLGSGATDDFTDGTFHWLKQGLAIRAGSTLTLTVPDAWRGHLAIGWGNPAHPSERITIDRCTYGPAKWLAYAGGYWVDKFACVPLIVESAGHRKTVRIPLGETCPVR